jgi:hypothetical protein
MICAVTRPNRSGHVTALRSARPARTRSKTDHTISRCLPPMRVLRPSRATSRYSSQVASCLRFRATRRPETAARTDAPEPPSPLGATTRRSVKAARCSADQMPLYKARIRRRVNSNPAGDVRLVVGQGPQPYPQRVCQGLREGRQQHTGLRAACQPPAASAEAGANSTSAASSSRRLLILLPNTPENRCIWSRNHSYWTALWLSSRGSRSVR